MSKITEVAELVEKGKAKLVGAAVQSALDEGCEATEILNSMIDAMAVVGERFKNGEIFVPEMLVAARAMKKPAEYEYPFDMIFSIADFAGKVKHRAITLVRKTMHQVCSLLLTNV